MHCRPLRLPALCLGVVVLCLQAIGPARGADILADFSDRIEKSKGELPGIIEAGEAVAARLVEHPTALIDVPYGIQQTFAEEVLNRAGGLSNALPSVERPRQMTDHDVLILGVSSWEVDTRAILAEMAKGKDRGSMIVLFASRAGMPEQAATLADFIVDNYAPDASEKHGEVNTLVNIANFWTWQCEYVAAMTRLGKYPGILQSIMVEAHVEHNRRLQRGDRRIQDDTEVRIEAGKLAAEYHARLGKLLSDMNSARTREQITKAAELIATELQAGRKVAVASCTHVLLSDIFRYRRTPIQPINVVWRADTAIKEALEPGELLVFVGYIGMSTPNEAYFDAIKEAGVRLISSHVHDAQRPENNATDSLVHIEQHWNAPDAEVKLPFPPGYMAPVSGLNQGLIYRMIEQQVAQRLAAVETAAQ